MPFRVTIGRRPLTRNASSQQGQPRVGDNLRLLRSHDHLVLPRHPPRLLTSVTITVPADRNTNTATAFADPRSAAIGSRVLRVIFRAAEERLSLAHKRRLAAARGPSAEPRRARGCLGTRLHLVALQELRDGPAARLRLEGQLPVPDQARDAKPGRILRRPPLRRDIFEEVLGGVRLRRPAVVRRRPSRTARAGTGCGLWRAGAGARRGGGMAGVGRL